MKISPVKNTDLLILEPKVYSDNRGFFFESFNQNVLNEYLGKKIHFVQDNHSKSKKNVLRGLHYQTKPMEQGKLVRVLSGKIFDVAVDIRKSSKNYGRWFSEVLSSENHKQFWIPAGYAHGFLVLEPKTEVLYKTTNFYDPKYERCIKYDDNLINIKWPNVNNYLLSKKDMMGCNFDQAELFN
jgi:dTDP-4-dehydrorhamnose 3,5-epimerase